MEESEILRALRQDPETGSSMLVEQYRYLLWGVCSRRLQDPEDAWDCVYEALADFCLQWQKFRPEKGSLKSYLIAIADRKAAATACGSARSRRPPNTARRAPGS